MGDEESGATIGAVERDVNRPAVVRRGTLAGLTAVMRGMAVEESVLVRGAEARQVRALAQQTRRTLEAGGVRVRFVVRMVEGGVRVWRDE